MTLAICIPIYNFNVCPLIEALYQQVQDLSHHKLEIIMIDDASAPTYKAMNAPVSKLGRYIGLTQNVGRSKIRNLFLKYSTAEYFLFLDGDALIIKDNFLQHYLQSIVQKQPKVICGGRLYPNSMPSKAQSLRWRYGHAKESQNAATRQVHPNRSFMTNNFVVQRALLESLPFDERLSQYGHEDTLFGYELATRGIGILHIENPILNADIETNAVFLSKTEAGVQNLANIIRSKEQAEDLINSVQLSRFYFAMPHPISKLYKWLFISSLQKPLKSLLLNKRIPLWCFDLYKLGCFAEYWEEKRM